MIRVAAAGVLVSLIVLSLAGCDCGRRRTAPLTPGPDQSYRDQFFFLPDEADAPIVALVAQRSGAGTLEVKGWLAADARFRAVVYEAVPIARGRAPSLEASIDEFGDQAHPGPLRLRVVRRDRLLDAELRTASAHLSLYSDDLRFVDGSGDPEGPARWSAGTAVLTLDDRKIPGVLVAEETAADAPLHTDVDYGDYTLAIARLDDSSTVVARRSATRPGFDFGMRFPASKADSAPNGNARPALPIAVAPGSLSLGDRALPILDRRTSEGVTDRGVRRRYEVLLLGGHAGRGIAFRIFPAPAPDGGV